MTTTTNTDDDSSSKIRIESYDKFMREFKTVSNGTKKQEQLLEIFHKNESFIESYARRTPNCSDLLGFLAESAEALSELGSSAISVNIGDTNVDLLLLCIESVLLHFRKQIDTLDANPSLLANRQELKTSLADLCEQLIEKYVDLIRKCITAKSSTPKIIGLQETCVRLLTIMVQTNVELAKRIALEFNYFSDYKNWVEKFLLMKQSDLREFSVQFLASFFKYAKTKSDANDKSPGDKDYTVLLKKIFLNQSQAITQTKSNKQQQQKSKQKPQTNQQQQQQQHSSSSLIYCLFLHLHVDSASTIDFLLQELLFKFIQSELFTKSEKIRIFNEKTLASLIKLFEWNDQSDSKDAPDQTLYVREMICEFLKVLFCSTRFGINFYDRTLNLDHSAKNYNHLIFNAMINIQRPQMASSKAVAAKTPELLEKRQKLYDIAKKTNDLIDDLLLRVLKVCPDLIQRFLKVKYKQESNIKAQNEDEWFIRFCIRLFEQQQLNIRNMRSNIVSSSSFLRSFAVVEFKFTPVQAITNQKLMINEKTLTDDNSEDLKEFLNEMVIQTSLPSCLPYQKLLAPQSNTSEKSYHYNLALKLFIASLNCLKEWNECLREIKVNLKQPNFLETIQLSTNQQDEQKYLIYENFKKIFNNSNENVLYKINFQLLSKYLPRFDVFQQKSIEINQENEEEQEKLVSKKLMFSRLLNIFTLYLDIFVPQTQNKNVEEFENSDIDDDSEMNYFNFLEVESLDESINKLLNKLISFKVEKHETIDMSLCFKYLRFLIKLIDVKHSQEYTDHTSYLIYGDLNSVFKQNYKSTSEDELLIDSSNVLILNFVKIIFKFKRYDSFGQMVDSYLKFFKRFLNLDFTDSDENPFSKDSMDHIYLWLIKLIDLLNSNELNDDRLLDYVYCCMINILDSKQRSFIIYELTRKLNQSSHLNFNDFLIYVCLKNYMIFTSCLKKDPIKDTIESFLIKYILDSSFIQLDNQEKKSLESIYEFLRVDELFIKEFKDPFEKFKLNLTKKSNDLKALIEKSSKKSLYSQSVLQSFELNLDNFNSGSIVTYLNIRQHVRIRLHLIESINHGSDNKLNKKDFEKIFTDLNEFLVQINKLFLDKEAKSNTSSQKKSETFENKDQDLLAFDSVENELENNDYYEIFSIVLGNKQISEKLYEDTFLNKFLKDLWISLKDQFKAFNDDHVNLKQASEKYYQMIKDFYQAFASEFVKLFHLFVENISNEKFKSNALNKSSLDLISKLDLDLPTFSLIMNDAIATMDFYLNRENTNNSNLINIFKLFVDLLIKYRSTLLDTNKSFYKNTFEVNDLIAELFYGSLKILLKSLKCLDHKALIEESDVKENLVSFISDSYDSKPNLIRNLLKSLKDKDASNNLSSFFSSDEKLMSIFEDNLDPMDDDDDSSGENEKSRAEEKKLFKSNNEKKLLDSYKFSMSLRDRKILNYLYKQDPTLKCLIFKSKSVEEGSKDNKLDAQASLSDFYISVIKESNILLTIRNYPTNRKVDDLKLDVDQLESQSNENEKDLKLANVGSSENIYDPIYMLPNIYYLLHPANLVDSTKFLHNKILSYLFASLSLECSVLRSLAYASIYRFMNHLEHSRVYFKNFIMYLFELLKHSLTIENQKMPSILTLFLAEATLVIIEPGTTLYKPITSFLLLKPMLDLTNVPEFYKLFNSSSLQYKQERKWILNVLISGCKSSFDYQLYEKRFVFRQILSIYDSRLSDNELKLSILNLLQNACKIKYALVNLVTKHWILTWLTNTLGRNSNEKLEINFDILQKKLEIFLMIWSKMKPNRETTKIESMNENEDEIEVESEEEEEEVEGEKETTKEKKKEKNFTQSLVFLNQMFTLARFFLKILSKNYKKLIDFQNQDLNDSKSIDEASKRSETYTKSLIKQFMQSIKEILEYLKSIHQISCITNSSSIKDNFSNFYKLSQVDLSNLANLLHSERSSLYDNEYFNILLENGFDFMNLSQLKFNWLFLMNYLSGKHLLKTIYDNEKQLKSLNSFLHSISGLRSDEMDDGFPKINPIESLEFLTLINLNEFINNLNQVVRKRNLSTLYEDLSDIHELYSQFTDKLNDVDRQDSNAIKRVFNSQMDLKDFKIKLKKLKKSN